MKIFVSSEFEGSACLHVHLVRTRTICVCLCMRQGSINCQARCSRAAQEPLLTLPHLGDLGSYRFYSPVLLFRFLINSRSNLLSPLFVLFSFSCGLFTLTFPTLSLLHLHRHITDNTKDDDDDDDEHPKEGGNTK